MKQQIEIDVPEGMRVGSIMVNGQTAVINLEPLPPKTKRRPPTKHDLLGVDSLPCWVRDSTDHAWQGNLLIAVSKVGGSARFHTQCTHWRYCEIEVPADEKPLRECWAEYYPGCGDPWGSAWPGPREKSIHMIEVRP